MRIMVYPVTIKSIDKIEGKDRIVYIHFNENGYGVIGDKSYSIGEKAAYFEVDSILPVNDNFDDKDGVMRKRCYNQKVDGFIIRNMHMCNLYSNGFIQHLNELKDAEGKLLSDYKKLPNDLTNILGVKKLEDYDDASPIVAKKNFMCDFMMKHSCTRWLARKIWFKAKVGGNFPTQYIDKSDETNIQNETFIFDKVKSTPCYITRKHEGQSVTMIMLPKKKSYDIKVFGRNSNGLERHYRYANKIGISDKFKKVWKDTHHCFAVQGEFCGPGVQSNIYNLTSYRFFVYTVKDVTTNKLLAYNELKEFCKKYDFETVKCALDNTTLEKRFKSIDELQDYVEHQWFYVKNGCLNSQQTDEWADFDDRKQYALGTPKKPDFHRWEGVVIRGLNNEFSFKVKSNQYQIDGL
jgi:hypothetical protein